MKTPTTTYHAANIAALLLTLGLSLYTFQRWTAARKLLDRLTPPVRSVHSPADLSNRTGDPFLRHREASLKPR